MFSYDGDRTLLLNTKKRRDSNTQTERDNEIETHTFIKTDRQRHPATPQTHSHTNRKTERHTHTNSNKHTLFTCCCILHHHVEFILQVLETRERSQRRIGYGFCSRWVLLVHTLIVEPNE